MRTLRSILLLSAVGVIAGCASATSLQRADPKTAVPRPPRVRHVSTGAGQLLVGIEFVDALMGFAVGGDRERGSPAVLVRTVDGGETWSSIEARVSARLYDVQFPSPDVGFACGLDGRILRSDDAGRSWSELAGFDRGWVAAVHFVDERRGFVAGAGSGMLLAVSDDGGASWRSLIDVVPEPVRGIGLRAIHFIDEAVGIATGTEGLIIRTTDGGATWERCETGTGAWLKSISFPTAQTGYVAGSGGTVLRTDDAGATWRDISAPARVKLNGVAFTTPDRGVLAAARGALWLTVDGGTSWSAIARASSGLTAAHAAPDGVIWVCTESGELLRIGG